MVNFIDLTGKQNDRIRKLNKEQSILILSNDNIMLVDCDKNSLLETLETQLEKTKNELKRLNQG
ncbi:hypothetical protein EMA8858_04083 [Emticicia aquatica]|uniref:Uncharacterized protein n=1 Tax=Emticicia aquatica TaxID=1681835 RepID=A0ABM9AWH6_9BACT|nr:hypothetical protein [Emticicia aquatica]CAH0997948.1 hypothetical protein EMA8858_04083 [Emticicia aquatica]